MSEGIEGPLFVLINENEDQAQVEIENDGRELNCFSIT